VGFLLGLRDFNYSKMVTALAFLIILSVLILVHEGGHFLAARRAGILVEEFGFGLPPRIWGKKIGETIYSINALPFGGFVRLYGEEEVVGRNKERAFSNKSQRVRIKILLSGVLMNLLLGVSAFCLVYSFLGIPEKANRIKVEAILEGSPSQEAGLHRGDIVDKFNGQEVRDNKTFIDLTNKSLGEQVILEVIREGEGSCQEEKEERPGVFLEREILAGGNDGENYSYCEKGKLLAVITPRVGYPQNEGPLGVVISDTEVKFYPFYKMIPKAIYSGFLEAFYWLKEILASLARLIFSVLAGRGTMGMDVAGPVGIYQITGEVAKTGGWALIQLAGILSVNLAVLNVIPFPALDGGRVAFVLSEKFLGKRKREKIELWANRVGMVILLLSILLVTINDIKRIKG